MSVFAKLFKPATPKEQPVSASPAVVEPLPKITGTTAQIAQASNPSPEAQKLMTPQQTPSEYVAALEQSQMSEDEIKFLAHSMPEKDSVGWACQSSDKVAGNLSPEDKVALDAAKLWVNNPTETNQAAAAAAAAKTDFQGPGAWAAQAAAWAKGPAPTAAAPTAAAPAATPPNGLTGNAVAGSVMLAAAIAAGKMPSSPSLKTPPTPANLQIPEISSIQTPPADIPSSAMSVAERTETAKAHQPFIDLGKVIAGGKQSPV